jgi:hypothetical protein
MTSATKVRTAMAKPWPHVPNRWMMSRGNGHPHVDHVW